MALQLSGWVLLAAAGVGILAGMLSGFLTLVLYKAEDLFERLPIHWMWWPALGGLVVGLGGLVEPRALGVGYDVIADLLGGDLALAAVLSILAVKAAIWVVALASGTSGGVLAPLLILGGAMGWLVGQVLPGEPGLWAMLGMAAMMGGTMRAPMTGVFFALELTGDLASLLPLLIATASAYAFTVLLLKRSILTEKIARRGRHITREYSVDPFELMLARDVMVTKVDVLEAGMTIGEAAEFLTASDHRHRSYPVVDAERRVVGIVGRGNVLSWRSEAAKEQTLYDKLSDAETIVAHTDDPLGYIADLMIENDTGRIPIVSRKTRQIEGLVSRKDILRLRAVRRLEEMERSVRVARPKGA
jgi:CBS domain-containing protein